MPKTTFDKLNTAKKERIIDAFIKEFSVHRYDDASLSRVVKELGIAKGSIYQYFEGKLDLYLHLKSYCEQVKMGHIIHVRRDAHQNFWSYYRALFEAGIQFDLENPRESRFLYRISKNEHSPSVKDFHQQWRDQAIEMFEGMLQQEVAQGFLRKDVPVRTMSFFMISATVHIGDYMQLYHGTDFDKNMAAGHTVFAQDREVLMQTADQFIKMLRNGFDVAPTDGE